MRTESVCEGLLIQTDFREGKGRAVAWQDLSVRKVAQLQVQRARRPQKSPLLKGLSKAEEA